ncbi:hypothetical protein AEQ67_15670 [Pseudomonas sp. RIT-PI-q]|uniref:DUF6966 domain-containing protein n=1 Tax=Pseudomonas sp. RIT-PI-q TaxID=1690247 RepID=UPI0006CDAB99|nr:hypothetical protein [Pseudomonas sp. RIT-PI-q]KPG98033.1 hypothetical protein AEQ67_15670 [Pseudomonas sp. RIT-PI-q]
MKSISKISSIIVQTTALLRKFGCPEWADKLEKCRLALPHDTTYALSQIVSLYGGSGSINDIVLYEQAKPLLDENNKLHALLAELYDVCVGSH